MNLLRVCAAVIAVLLAGCAGHAQVTGHIAGRLVSEGGRQPGQRPMPGTVAFTAAGHHQVTVRVGNSGIFSVELPPGSYQVFGPCSRPVPVTVTANHTTHVNVICIIPVSSSPSA
jgi:hypothetical protein